MSEGGRFPWKKFLGGSGGRKERLRESLPKPPTGMDWLQDKKTREWKLVPEHELPIHKEEEVITVDFSSNNHETNPPKESKGAFENPFGIGEQNNDEDDVEDDEDLVFDNPDLQASEATEKTANVVHEHCYDPVPSSKPMTTITTPTFENMPTDFSESKHGEEDWELLSERYSSTHNSSNSIGEGMAFVSRSGSVRSSVGSFRVLQRCPSNSTIDSTDFNLGPSGKGILGVDYVEHVILPTDTLQGICLAYKISASRLKRANHFSGESLQLAPKRLIIPISQKALKQGYLRVQDTDSKEYKLHAFQAEFPSFGLAEARAYLELSDWVLKDACVSARDDTDLEIQEHAGNEKLRAGEIRVMMNVTPHPDGPYIDFSAQGAGYSPPRMKNKQTKPVSHNTVQAKTVKMEDVHAVSPQHNSFGVELQSLNK